jgi:predicted MFS family arabinose efflux permease
MMYTSAAGSADSVVSAIWNAAYDAGMGAGAAVFGLLAARTGYPAAFLLTAGLIVPALAPACRERRPLVAPAPSPPVTQEETATRRSRHR